MMELKTQENWLMVVTGNSFNIKDKLKGYGFKFNWDFKVWYRELGDRTAYYSDKAYEAEILKSGCEVIMVNGFGNLRPAIEFSVQEERELNPPETIEHEYTNQVVEVTKWYARVVAEELGNEIAFRNIKITNVYKETSKAMLVDFEFYGGIGCSCGVCGRGLTNAVSKATGIGPVCAMKMGMPRPTMENAIETVKLLEEKVKELKTVESKWVPLSQIKNVI